ncbi:angiomotin-like protein 1 isoform X2 [Mya arenaria]|uniref:angiomotin-like protein 1 isoform X2 n=1 Tax=Mya arenaria TaxID=6604 RepID=UPI0022E041FB|nr:angiomotin-like protein 1 isoform X2 [Mya arenaria]
MVLDVQCNEIGIINREMHITDYSSAIHSPENLYQEIYMDMSQFREPPPYPGHPTQSQTGLRQSFSGSETSTDVSVSSTENLASGQRQEPQGEETQVPNASLSYDLTGSSEYSILERLGMPTSEMEKLQSVGENPPQIYVTPGNVYNTGHGPFIATSVNSPIHYTGLNQFHTGHMAHHLYQSNESGFSSASSKHQLGETGSNQSLTMASGFSNDSSPNYTQASQNTMSSSPNPVCSYNSSTLYANYPQHHWAQHSAIDTASLTAGHDMSHLHHQVPPYMSPSVMHTGLHLHSLPHHHYASNPLPPPPDYPGMSNPEATRRSYELLGKSDIPGSRSHPDLHHSFDPRTRGAIIHTPHGSGSDRGSQQSLEHGRCGESGLYSDIDHLATQATRMVEVLSEENRSLRQKLSVYDRKVTKLQKFEMEIQKVHEGYESLQKSSKKREQLEQAMKKRLEDELKKLKALNNGLIQQLQKAGQTVPENAILASIEPTDSSMLHLLAKHKEVLVEKDRVDMELEAVRNENQAQRSQIEILRNVQAQQSRRDVEEQRQQLLADYDEEIKQELSSIKAAYEKKEQTERNIRQKLEKELEFCRANHSQHSSLGRGMEPKGDLNSDIKKLLEEKEAKILQLEKELIQWKEQQLEESIRKLKLQEMDVDMGSRLPLYDQGSSMCSSTCSSVSTETLINEAKVDKLKQMEEVYQANRQVTELEARVKSLQSQLSEKEAMLRVYQRSPMTRSSSVHTIYCPPHHSPRPSLVASGSLSRQGSQDAGALLEVRHKKTGSTSALENYSHITQEELLKRTEHLKSEAKTSSTSDTENTPDTVWQV